MPGSVQGGQLARANNTSNFGKTKTFEGVQQNFERVYIYMP
jgi:hypothetical protein